MNEARALASYLKASNGANIDVFRDTLGDDVFVNDVQREFWGRKAIRIWAEREIFGANVAMEIVRAVDHYGDVILPLSWTVLTTRPVCPIR